MRTNYLFTAPLVFAGALFLATIAMGQKPAAGKKAEQEVAPLQGLTTTIEVGGTARLVDGEKSFGLQQRSDIPRGGMVRRLDVKYLREGNPRLFTFRSTDFLQRDGVFLATFEDIGRYKLTMDSQNFARFWSSQNTIVPAEISRGVFVVPEALRGALQGAATPAAMVALMANAVSVSPQVSIRAFRERRLLTYAWQVKPNVEFKVQYLNERRSGNRLWSSGTYSRIGTPTGDTFETPGQEMFEPTAYQTNEIGVELNYSRKRVFLGVEYRGSFFGNAQPGITWQNPFVLTPQQATQPAGALERGRFAATQAALPPANQAHTFAGHAMVLLPRSSRASALVSWSGWAQNEQFLPITINTAITAVNLPAGVTPTSLSALPAQSLKGVMHVLTQDYALVSHPFRQLQFKVHYNDYDLANETPKLHFPAYAAYGDSWWRTSISGQPGTTNLAIENEPKSFRRERADFEAAVRPGMDLTWKASYRLERYHREQRQVALTRENGFLTSLTYAPKTAVFAQAGFRYFDRSPDAYKSGTLEPAFLRMHDQAQRVRKQADLVASVNLTSTVTLSTSLFYLGDTYDKNFFGLHQMKTSSVNGDVSWNARENFGLYAGWGYDRNGFDYLSIAKTAAPYNFANVWTRDTRDGVHYAQLGFSGAFAGRRGEYQLGYAASLARMVINTTNPFPINPTDALNAQAYPFPDVKNQFHEVRVNTSYALSPKVRLGFYYLLEPYRLNDFAGDIIQPYAPQNLAPENDARRFQFADVGLSNYTGNVISVYLRYSFN